MSNDVTESVPGVLVLGFAAVTSYLLGTSVPLLSPLVFAIAVGAVLSNTGRLPGWAEKGVSKHSLFLETAIVLLGASLSLSAILAAGPLLIVLVIAVVTFGLMLVTILARGAGVNNRLGSLLAAGASVCGVSAIAAVTPACDAEESKIAHAAATILLFDAVTLLVFPIVGRLLDLDPQLYGVWIGLSMFSTGPVAAAGFAHSPVAGEWATMTKLARNSLIGAVAVWYSLRNSKNVSVHGNRSLGRIWTDFPKFLVGFVTLAILTNTGVIPEPAVTSIERASDALFLLAFAGLGFEIRVSDMRNTGTVPIGIVAVYLITISSVTYLLVSFLF